MSYWFVVTIGFLWAGAAFSAWMKQDVGTAIMYTGFVIAQAGMALNALK